MEIAIAIIIALIISSFVGGLLLWIAGKITGTDPYYMGMVLVAGASALTSTVFDLLAYFTNLGLFSFIGWLASIIVMFVLIKKFTLAKIVPDILVMVVVYKIFSALLGLFFTLAR